MADRKYEIEIITTHTTSGASSVAQELRETAAAADEAKGALDNLGAGNPFKETQQGAADAAKEVGDLAEAAAASGDDAAKANPKLAQYSAALSGLNQAARGGPEALTGLGRAIEGVAKSTGLSVGGLTSALGALALGFQIGQSIRGFIEDINDAKHPLLQAGGMADQLKSKMEGLSKVRVDFGALRDEIDGVAKRMDFLIKENDRMNSALNKKTDAQTSAKIADVEQGMRRDLAGASTDAERDAIREQAEIKKRLIQADAEQEKLSREMVEKQKQLSTMQNAQMEYEERSSRARENAAIALETYQKAVEELARSGLNARSLLTDRESLARETQQARATAESGGPDAQGAGRLASVMESLPALFERMAESQRESQAVMQELIAPQGELARQIMALNVEVDALKSQLETAAKSRENQRFDLGGDAMGALGKIEAAIREQQARVDEARERVASAQTQGSMDQGPAFSALQAAEEQLRQLRSVGESLRTEISNLGEAGASGAQAAAGAMERGKTALESSAQAVVAGANKSASDVQGAATKATEAMGNAQGAMASGISNLGRAVESGFNAQVAVMDRVVDKVGAISRRLDAVAARAAAAESAALAAAIQVAEAR